VQPGAGRTAVVGRHGDALKLRVAAPPENGRANDACVALLADLTGVEPTAIELVGGATSRAKRFKLTSVEVDDVVQRLDLALDQASGNAIGRGSVPKFPGAR